MVKETYRDHFVRPIEYANLRPYEEEVVPHHGTAVSRDVSRFIQLYQDCFSHHIQPEVHAERERLVVTDDTRRIIQADNLTSRFLKAHYRLPRICATADSGESEQQELEVDFDRFVKLVSDTPLAADFRTTGTLGSNRFSYLIGDVGMGKTMLVMKLIDYIRDMPVDSLGFRTVPVYVDFDRVLIGDDDKLKDVDDELFAKVYEAIRRTISGSPRFATTADLSLLTDFGDDTPFEQLRKLCHFLADRQLRIMLLFDNTDRYHFYYSKHSFFGSDHDRQTQGIKRNFSRLTNAFVDTTELGALGLCVLLVCRRYVFEDLRRHREAVSTQESIYRDHIVCQLMPISVESVVNSRFDLLKEAVIAISKARRGASVSYETQLEELKVAFIESLTDSKAQYGLNTVYRMSHHGLRNFVAFIGAIRLDYRSDYEIIDRLFKTQQRTLVRLYMTDRRKRFTQKNGHFPNLFLNDAVIAPEAGFEKYYRPHEHTYWLKYLMLKYVFIQPRGVATVAQIKETFIRRAGFDENLVLLALGSLCMANASRCLDIEYAGTGTVVQRVRATERGLILMEATPDTPGRDRRVQPEFCLGFEYLQLVVDDYLMSFPEPWLHEVYVEADLNYTLKDGTAYALGSWEYLQKKTKATLYFVRILKASLAWERDHRPALLGGELGVALMPNIDEVAVSLLRTCEKILEHYTGGLEYTASLWRLWPTLNENTVFDDFFAGYGSSKILVDVT